ncbi:MAG: hypothetical protein WA160_03310 [Pseudobdellovibrio sp.]
MKTIIMGISTALVSLSLHASPIVKPTEFKFTFNQSKPSSFVIKKTAANKDAAFKLAAKDCFQTLTKGQYPGEERGLDIIDICANPKM